MVATLLYFLSVTAAGERAVGAFMTSSSKMALAVMAMNTLPLGGMLVFVTGQRAQAGAGAAVAAPGPMLQLVNQVVQLKPGENGRDLHAIIDFDLELTSDQGRSAVIQRLPQVRDLVISRLWEITAAELRRPGGLDELKADLRERLNGLVPGAPIRKVYVVDFLIQ
jgi:flagellar basal body-associated protein FliL